MSTSIEETLEMNDREEALYLKIIELREYLKLVKNDDSEIERTKDKILILQDELCSSAFWGHYPKDENDNCLKCGQLIDEYIDFTCSSRVNDNNNYLRDLHNELGLHYEEED